MTDSVAEAAWERQSVWSQTANRLKAWPARLRVLRLTLTAAAAVFALAGSQVKPASPQVSLELAITAAAALALTGVLRGIATPGQARNWTRARAVSEAIKAEVYLYLCSGGSYQSGDRDEHLTHAVARLERETGDLHRYTLDVKPIERPLPLVHDVPSYLALRIQDSQLARFYIPKATLMRRRLRTLKAIEVTLALVAAGLAALASYSPSVGAWAAVATTVGGAVAAYLAGERYEFLWIEYSRTASELQRLLHLRTSADGQRLTDAELAAECEDVISIQTEAWMAKWGEGDDGAAYGGAN